MQRYFNSWLHTSRRPRCCTDRRIHLPGQSSDKNEKLQRFQAAVLGCDMQQSGLLGRGPWFKAQDSGIGRIGYYKHPEINRPGSWTRMSTMYFDNPLAACAHAFHEQCNRIAALFLTPPEEVGKQSAIMLQLCSPAGVPCDVARPAEACEGFCQQCSAFLGQRRPIYKKMCHASELCERAQSSVGATQRDVPCLKSCFSHRRACSIRILGFCRLDIPTLETAALLCIL